MKPISVDMVRFIASMVKKDGETCDRCIFKVGGCVGCKCSVGNVLKRLADEGFLSIDENVDAKGTPPAKGPKPLPAWCEKGAWVLYDDYLLATIKGFETVFEDGSTTPTTYVVLRSHAPRTKLPFSRLLKQIQPVRFREYSFEEAKGLIGKTMEYCDKRLEYRINNEDPSVDHASLIYRISRNNNCGEIFINSKSFHELQGSHATINGVPIGIPEVDKEAMKEVEE